MKGFIELKKKNGARYLININYITEIKEQPIKGNSAIFQHRKGGFITNESYYDVLNLIKKAQSE